MHSVILDGYSLNPGDLDWDGFKALGTVDVYDRTAEELVVERAKDAQYLITNKTPLSEKTLQALPSVQYIGVLATGFNVVDVGAAKRLGITVTNIPTYGTRSVAQMVFAHLLNLTQHVAEHSSSVRDGDWTSCKDFCYWNFPLVELNGLTLGLVGYGRIGQATADVGRALGMKIVAYDPYAQGTSSEKDVEFVSLQKLFSHSDVVSLHCPLTKDNTGFVNKDLLSTMKKSAFLINTSRGQLINEKDLAWALREGVLAGAGLDVVDSEPITEDNPLLHVRNCYITPHIAWATFSARKRLMDMAAQNLKAFVEGKPINVVS